MNGQCITFEHLIEMGSHFKKLGVNDYVNLAFEKYWYQLNGEDRLKAARRVIELGYVKPNHGDGFHWLGEGYRNEGLMFWHDEKGILYPYTEIDDYGSVPPDFRIGNGEKEFLPEHWQNIVDHNNIIFLSDDLMEEIKAAYPSAKPLGERRKSILLEIKGYPYKVILYNDCPFEGLPWATYNRNIIYFQEF